MLVKVPKLERLVYIGRLPDAEFKEHLKRQKELKEFGDFKDDLFEVQVIIYNFHSHLISENCCF